MHRGSKLEFARSGARQSPSSRYDWDPVSPTEWGTKQAGTEGREAFIFDQLQPHDDVTPLLD
eukprot:634921-Pyramimonas_sp.AAC.1